MENLDITIIPVSASGVGNIVEQKSFNIVNGYDYQIKLKQQKVILGRWLATNPDFLILDEPTRGIDIGTKTEIQKLIIKLAKEGKAVIFISSEIEEMLRTCDRMVVLRDGVKVGEIDDEMTQNSIMKAIAGGDKDE